jgi:hypothetical protein
MKLIQHLVKLLETQKRQSSRLRDEFYSSRAARSVFEEDSSDDDDDDDVNTFYVVFYEDGRSWIGKVTKENGNKWREKKYKGEPHYNWGTTYMGYLVPDQVMTWIHKDYDDDGVEIKGPFLDPEEAEEYVKYRWGNLK